MNRGMNYLLSEDEENSQAEVGPQHNTENISKNVRLSE